MRETWVQSLGWEGPLEEGKGYPLQYFGLENSMGTVHGVAKSQTRLIKEQLLLLNVFCFCTISVLYCAHLCMKISLGISNFLEETSNLSHSIVFLYFFALIIEEGFLISPCYSLEL